MKRIMVWMGIIVFISLFALSAFGGKIPTRSKPVPSWVDGQTLYADSLNANFDTLYSWLQTYLVSVDSGATNLGDNSAATDTITLIAKTVELPTGVTKFGTGATDTTSFTGPVGIGTASPKASLHIKTTGTVGSLGQLHIDGTSNDSTNISYITFSRANETIQGYIGETSQLNSDFYLWAGASRNLRIGANATHMFIATSTGNVGIGTTSPDKLLGLSDGTDEYSISVASDKLTFWNDAATPVALATIDSSSSVDVVGALTAGTITSDGVITGADTRMPTSATGSPVNGSFYLGAADTMWVYSGSAWKYTKLN